jgi:hypothetical protein
MNEQACTTSGYLKTVNAAYQSINQQHAKARSRLRLIINYLQLPHEKTRLHF